MTTYPRKLTLALLAGALLLLSAPATAPAAGPLDLALSSSGPFYGFPVTSMQHAKRTGAGALRIYMGWADIAPKGATKPAGFDPRNPADPHYDWTTLDEIVRAAKAEGIEPILSIETAPEWAERAQGTGWPGGTNNPDPAEFGAFGEALARRYSGSFQGLPRVKYYEAWNEPNHYRHLNPQYEATQPQGIPGDAQVDPNAPFYSADVYRPMLNAFYDGVHGVNPDNTVIAGSLSPTNRPFRFSPAVAPLTWMRAFLCLDNNDRQKPGCNEQAKFDAWAINPYTSGDPEHHAAGANDVSIPEIPKMRRVLLAAERAGQVVSTHNVQLWATEWSWDSNPPDPGGVPMKLLKRWISEGIYRMWSSGVSLITWFQLRDDLPNGGPYSDSFQSGLYFNCKAQDPKCDKAKPTLEAFRFPFVAYKRKSGILIWGRTPFAQRGRVTVKQKGGRSWKLKTNGFGIFTKVLKSRGKGDLLARFGHENSVPFSLKVPPDRPGNPFG